MNVSYEKAERARFGELACLAERVWHSAFDGLIGEAQTSYMINKFQSVPAFVRQTSEEGYEYYFICVDGVAVGYTAIASEDGDRLFLSKLYLTSEMRGRGLAVKTLDFVKKKADEKKKRVVYLTVNKGNARAIAVYERYGFKRTRAAVTDIGGGFVMDDYVYELVL